MSSQFTIKIEKELKNQALQAAQNLGIPLATLTKVFYQHLIRTKKITFTLGKNVDLDVVIDQALESARVAKSLHNLAGYVVKNPLKKRS